MFRSCSPSADGARQRKPARLRPSKQSRRRSRRLRRRGPLATELRGRQKSPRGLIRPLLLSYGLEQTPGRKPSSRNRRQRPKRTRSKNSNTISGAHARRLSSATRTIGKCEQSLRFILSKRSAASPRLRCEAREAAGRHRDGRLIAVNPCEPLARRGFETRRAIFLCSVPTPYQNSESA